MGEECRTADGPASLLVISRKHIAEASAAPKALKNCSIFVLSTSSKICCKISTGLRLSNSSVPVRVLCKADLQHGKSHTSHPPLGGGGQQKLLRTSFDITRIGTLADRLIMQTVTSHTQPNLFTCTSHDDACLQNNGCADQIRCTSQNLTARGNSPAVLMSTNFGGGATTWEASSSDK